MSLPLWQSPAWKAFQESLGREMRIYEHSGARAQVVIDRTMFGLSVWDIPRGPIWTDEQSIDSLLSEIIRDAKKDRCMSIFLSPLQQIPSVQTRMRISGRHEQPVATRILDLSLTEEDLLKQMKPKGRYNIKVADKHDVEVTLSQDIDAFYALLQKTGARDRFGIQSKKHYEQFLKHIPDAFLLLAHAKDSPYPIAGLIGVVWGHTGYYYYGASDYAHRSLMAPFALQWSAMKHCKAQGCTQYDLLGIAPPDTKSHPWNGASVFKEKFGGTVVMHPEECEISLRPLTYAALKIKRMAFG